MLAGDAVSVSAHRREMGDRSRSQPCPVRRPQGEGCHRYGPGCHVDLRAPWRNFRRPAQVRPSNWWSSPPRSCPTRRAATYRGRAARRGSPPDGNVPCDEHRLGQQAGAVSRVAHDRRCHQRGRSRMFDLHGVAVDPSGTPRSVFSGAVSINQGVVGTQLERHPCRRSGTRRADRRSRVRAGGRSSAGRRRHQPAPTPAGSDRAAEPPRQRRRPTGRAGTPPAKTPARC